MQRGAIHKTLSPLTLEGQTLLCASVHTRAHTHTHITADCAAQHNHKETNRLQQLCLHILKTEFLLYYYTPTTKMMRFCLLFCLATLWTVTTTAFAPFAGHATKRLSMLSRSQHGTAAGIATTATSTTTTTSLMERRWNFNEGQAPWGMKKNAETWNGRVAQMAFVLVFLQELIQGKGVVQGLLQGDPVNLACASAFVVVVIGLTGWLALQGEDDYVTRDM